MKRLIKISLYILLSLFILIGITYISSGFIFNRIIHKKIDNQLVAQIYKVNFKNAYLDVFNLGISITDLEIIPDSSDKSLSQYKYHKNIAHIQFKRVSLTNINILAFIQEKQVDISKVKFIKPHVKIYQNNHYEKGLKEKAKPENKEDQNDLVDLIALDEILVKNMSIEYYSQADRKPELYIKSINIIVSNPIINHKQFPELNKVISADQFTLEMSNISFLDQKGLYDIELEKLTFNDNDSIVMLEELHISPLLNKSKFAKKHKYQCDRYEGDVKSISIESLDLTKLVKDRIISIDKINIKQLNLEIYRDKNYPFNANNSPKLPQQALRSMKQKMEINSIQISESNLVYMETAENESKPGKVAFHNIAAQVSNFGNTKQWQASKELKIDAQTKVYGQSQLHAQFNFPLASNTFYFSGQLEKTEMSIFNEMTIHTAGVKVKQGIIDKMNFNVVANSTKSTGVLNLYYHDLKIALLKDEDEDGLVKEKKMLNFLANNILVPIQNPNKKDQFYESKIDFERVKSKGVINYLWKSVFSGIKDTFLKNHNDEQSYSKKNNKNESGFSKREIRKKARQEKRKDKNR